jgi:hypothetical protein
MFLVLDFGSLDLAKSGMRKSRPTVAYLAFLEAVRSSTLIYGFTSITSPGPRNCISQSPRSAVLGYIPAIPPAAVVITS